MFSIKEIEISKFYNNRLFYDYIFNFSRLKNFFSYDYHEAESYDRRLKEIYRFHKDSFREKMVSGLLEYNSSLGCGNETRKNIEKLGRNDAVVVIGGQQPGLFTGPMFIIYKVLTVIKLSFFLGNRLRVPVIPVFWNASDDSNPEYINSIKLLNGDLHELKMELSGLTGNTRFSRIFLESGEYLGVLKKAESLLRDTGFKEDVLEFFRSAVSQGVSSYPESSGRAGISRLFSLIMLKLFKKWGIVIIDPDDHFIKRSSMDLISRDIKQHSEIREAIDLSGAELRDLGYHAQITQANRQNSLDFFIDMDGKRERVTIAGPECAKGETRYGIKTGSFNKMQLLDLCRRHPENICPDVITRPLLQDTLLPVLATVCGPGEVSYFAQLGKIYPLINMKLPVVYPRFSATLVEEKVKKRLGKLDPCLRVPESEKEELLKRALDRKSSGMLEEATGNLEKDIIRNINNLEYNLSDGEIDLTGSFDRIKRNLSREIRVLQKKLYSEYKKKDSYLRESLDIIYLNLLPGREMQERQINIIYYLNKYGFSIIDEIYECIEIMNFSHKFLYF